MSVPSPPAMVSVLSRFAVATVSESFPVPRVKLSAPVEEAVIISAPEPVVTDTAVVAPREACNAPVNEPAETVTISASKAVVIVKS